MVLRSRYAIVSVKCLLAYSTALHSGDTHMGVHVSDLHGSPDAYLRARPSCVLLHTKYRVLYAIQSMHIMLCERNPL